MPYRLREDLSFCRIDGHLIFLDVLNDLYFRLSAPLESAFLRHISGNGDGSADISDLVERRILVEADGPADTTFSAAAQTAIRSAVELGRPSIGVRPSTILRVSMLVLSTRLQLKAWRLKDTVERMSEYRERQAANGRGEADLEQHYVTAANQFMHARRNVPIETRCLLDSIALVKYLAGHGLRAHLVFGVCADPFSAHCWVQTGSLVLNDTLGNVSAHMPIRVI